MMMKKLIALLILSVFVVNCGDGDKKKTPDNSDVPVQKQDKSTEKPDDNPKLTEDQVTSNNYNDSEDVRSPTVENNEKVDTSLPPKAGENLIVNCESDNHYFVNCSLHNGVLAEGNGNLKQYKIDYLYQCEKGHLVIIDICTDNGCKDIVPVSEKQILLIEGRGNLVIKENENFNHASFVKQSGCSFFINKIKANS